MRFRALLEFVLRNLVTSVRARADNIQTGLPPGSEKVLTRTMRYSDALKFRDRMYENSWLPKQ